MAISIKNPEVGRLARELTDLTGETITEVIEVALKERLEREKGIKMREEIKQIQNRINRLPRLDTRSDEEIIGYNDKGYPV